MYSMAATGKSERDTSMRNGYCRRPDWLICRHQMPAATRASAPIAATARRCTAVRSAAVCDEICASRSCRWTGRKISEARPNNGAWRCCLTVITANIAQTSISHSRRFSREKTQATAPSSSTKKKVDEPAANGIGCHSRMFGRGRRMVSIVQKTSFQLHGLAASARVLPSATLTSTSGLKPIGSQRKRFKRAGKYLPAPSPVTATITTSQPAR